MDLDKDTMARTAWGEAANMGASGMQATLNTVVNRLKSGRTWWGKDFTSICLFQARGIHQYSCWNKDNKQLGAIHAVTDKDPLFAIALELADKALDDKLQDITNGATHYVNHLIVKPLPSWCKDEAPVCKIEPHWYYRVL